MLANSLGKNQEKEVGDHHIITSFLRLLLSLLADGKVGQSWISPIIIMAVMEVDQILGWGTRDMDYINVDVVAIDADAPPPPKKKKTKDLSDEPRFYQTSAMLTFT